MSKMKHTPGPWVCHSGAVYQDGPNIWPKGEEDGSRLLLADRDNPQTSPCERDRNVELAAAAPDLLDACRAALAHLAEPLSDTASRENRIDELAAAIAEAEGTA